MYSISAPTIRRASWNLSSFESAVRASEATIRLCSRAKRVDRRQRDVLVRADVAGHDRLLGRRDERAHQVDRRCGHRRAGVRARQVSAR
jgi:hypothetical protein